MFLRRLITALVLIPVVLWCIFTDLRLVFAAFTGIVLLLAAWEWAALIGLKSVSARIGYMLLIIFLLGLLLFLPPSLVMLLGIVIWIWLSAVTLCYANEKSLCGLQFKSIQVISGALVLAICWLSVNLLRQLPQGPLWVLFAFSLVWSADTGAYLAGQRWGKHALAKRISPHKTWEGVAGGVVMVLCISAGVAFFLPEYFEKWRLLPLSVLLILFSIFGDLFESVLKRLAHQKDSGRLLPGHGGVLDRIDSLLAVLPLFVFLRWWWF